MAKRTTSQLNDMVRKHILAPFDDDPVRFMRAVDNERFQWARPMTPQKVITCMAMEHKFTNNIPLVMKKWGLNAEDIFSNESYYRYVVVNGMDLYNEGKRMENMPKKKPRDVLLRSRTNKARQEQ